MSVFHNNFVSATQRGFTHPDDVRHAGDDMPSAPPPGEGRTPSFPPSRTDDMPTTPPVGEMNKIKRRLSTYRSNMWQYRRAYRKAKREYERSGDAFFLKRMMRYRRMYRLNKQAYRALKRKYPTL